MRLRELTLLVLAAGLATACTTIKDTDGKQVGTCFGAPCLLHAMIGDDVVAARKPVAAPVSSQDREAHADDGH